MFYRSEEETLVCALDCTQNEIMMIRDDFFTCPPKIGTHAHKLVFLQHT